VHGFYRYAVAHHAMGEFPFTAATRPRVDDETMTSWLTRTEVRAWLTAAAEHSCGAGTVPRKADQRRSWGGSELPRTLPVDEAT
jgi:alpha-beta hydrolase superfamily lysophospholipase